jgi:type I restriction-modification system DNA methylase subunit
MNALLSQIDNGSRPDKEEAKKIVKEKQLLGFEVNPTMYICAVSNMLFRGDGKVQYLIMIQ